MQGLQHVGVFVNFLEQNQNELKSEFYIQTTVNELIQDGTITLTVFPPPSKWFGVPYAADRPATVAQFRKLVDEGVYPEKLF